MSANMENSAVAKGLAKPVFTPVLKKGGAKQYSNYHTVQFSRSVVSDSLWPHGLQHASLPCPSPSLRVCSNSCPLTRWCHPTISSSVVPIPSCLQSFPAPGSFPMSRLLSLELTKNVNLMILLSNFVSYHCNDCENYWPSFLYSKLILNFWLFSPLLPLSGKLLL